MYASSALPTPLAAHTEPFCPWISLPKLSKRRAGEAPWRRRLRRRRAGSCTGTRCRPTRCASRRCSTRRASTTTSSPSTSTTRRPSSSPSAPSARSLPSRTATTSSSSRAPSAGTSPPSTSIWARTCSPRRRPSWRRGWRWRRTTSTRPWPTWCTRSASGRACRAACRRTRPWWTEWRARLPTFSMSTRLTLPPGIGTSRGTSSPSPTSTTWRSCWPSARRPGRRSSSRPGRTFRRGGRTSLPDPPGRRLSPHSPSRRREGRAGASASGCLWVCSLAAGVE